MPLPLKRTGRKELFSTGLACEANVIPPLGSIRACALAARAYTDLCWIQLIMKGLRGVGDPCEVVAPGSAPLSRSSEP